MALQLIVLALATAVRPTSLAAVYALLLSPAPRRLMWAYVLVGAAFTISVGLFVILALHGVSVRPEKIKPHKGGRRDRRRGDRAGVRGAVGDREDRLHTRL